MFSGARVENSPTAVIVSVLGEHAGVTLREILIMRIQADVEDVRER